MSIWKKMSIWKAFLVSLPCIKSWGFYLFTFLPYLLVRPLPVLIWTVASSWVSSFLIHSLCWPDLIPWQELFYGFLLPIVYNPNSLTSYKLQQTISACPSPATSLDTLYPLNCKAINMHALSSPLYVLFPLQHTLLQYKFCLGYSVHTQLLMTSTQAEQCWHFKQRIHF